MRVLINTWAWPTHYYQMVPLAWALRSAGHEVLVASQPAQRPVAEATGMPFVAVGHDVDVVGMIRAIVQGGGSPPEPQRGWARKVPRSTAMWLALAEAMADDLAAVARRWAPDLVLHEPSSWAGPLAAAVIDVPAVRFPWGADIMAAMQARKGVLEGEVEALAPLCERFDLDGVDTLGSVTVDPCPPGMQVPDLAHHRTGIRYVPFNGPGQVPPWLFERSDRPRVCVTWGTTVGRVDAGKVLAGEVARAIADLGAEVVVAVDRAQRDSLGALPDQVLVAESVPLHLLLPGCAAVVGHGGAGTIMTGLVSGLPQVAVPLLPDHRFNATRLAASGAGILLSREEAGPDRIRESVRQVLEEPGHRKAAGELRAQIEAQPHPRDLVPRLEELAGGS
ncbi:DUF1205 domain-containing protein [Saccharopolyspora indica]|uniref:nucleotide disphospho-sugar-binding domain-containing protein n=1 Tax=Saccharopolyspora indica TaxID=1229659 RepID=UPI0022EA9282|nr:nucleotide disphospho-sugar-binding domain-containing protein [Saccharopolyspora indica]MDA3647658.1 DUF1205 domain-containing protein [Saccharopolyspora indica]